MRKLARILGIVGAIGAIVWAMRDRFVSVAVPREPEPPTFRPARPPAAPTTETDVAGDGGSLTDVNGIGPVYATRLADIGVTTIPLLARARPEQVAAAAGVPLSRAAGWVDQARQHTEET